MIKSSPAEFWFARCCRILRIRGIGYLQYQRHLYARDVEASARIRHHRSRGLAWYSEDRI